MRSSYLLTSEKKLPASSIFVTLKKGAKRFQSAKFNWASIIYRFSRISLVAHVSWCDTTLLLKHFETRQRFQWVGVKFVWLRGGTVTPLQTDTYSKKVAYLVRAEIYLSTFPALHQPAIKFINRFKAERTSWLLKAKNSEHRAFVSHLMIVYLFRSYSCVMHLCQSFHWITTEFPSYLLLIRLALRCVDLSCFHHHGLLCFDETRTPVVASFAGLEETF
jgi:hypothetical protein